MANIQPSGTSITALPAGAPVKDLSLDEEGRRVAGEEATEERVSSIGSAAAGKNGSADSPQVENQISEADRGERGPDINIEDTTAGASAYVSDVTSLSSPNPTNGDDDDTTAPAIQVPQLQSPLTEHSSADPEQIPTTTAQPQPQHPHPPLKRFTSVNITKRFLEKTPSISGTPSGGSPLVGHASGGAGMSGSGQGRGASPSCVSGTLVAHPCKLGTNLVHCSAVAFGRQARPFKACHCQAYRSSSAVRSLNLWLAACEFIDAWH